MLLEKAAENLFLYAFFLYGCFIVSVFNMWVGASVYWVQTVLAKPLYVVLTAVYLMLCVRLLLSVRCAHCCVPHALCPLSFVCMLCSLLYSCSVSTFFCLYVVLTAVDLMLCPLLSVCCAHCYVPHALCPLLLYVVLTDLYLMLCVHLLFSAGCCPLLAWPRSTGTTLTQPRPSRSLVVGKYGHTGREYRTHTFVGRSIVYTPTLVGEVVLYTHTHTHLGGGYCIHTYAWGGQCTHTLVRRVLHTHLWRGGGDCTHTLLLGTVYTHLWRGGGYLHKRNCGGVVGTVHTHIPGYDNNFFSHLPCRASRWIFYLPEWQN